MDREDLISREFLARGYKVTKQRRAILSVLDKSEHPLTAEDIYLRIRAENNVSSLATVYRNLKTLVDTGYVVKAGLFEDKVRYRLQNDPHTHNLICLGCKKVIPLSTCPLNCLGETLGEKEGFTVTGHKMELYGYCFECEHKGDQINRK
ncbi:transcriptional repressor [Dehalobacterium formicoaceticum]|uniref:Transcriptional repressor n=1 Tax=Dehalobacterium formicoaceticum TaxID=51515 RepID=A0ABT1XZP8_9FIRM|nr:transcriptional repressor [Dehalobacterium formicoaceticum]MCR6544085.1 transcriptional repressor [Dehalobacterium formicoaceticum]